MATISDITRFVLHSSKAAVALYFGTLLRIIRHWTFWAIIIVTTFTVLLATMPGGTMGWTIAFYVLLIVFIFLLLAGLLMLLMFSGNSPVPICLPTDLQVSTPSGRVEVGELKPGSLVWSWDMGSGRQVARRVNRIRFHGPRPILRIGLRHRPAFFATAYHSVLCEAGWRRCGKLRVGDRLVVVSDSGARTSAEITSVTTERERKAVCSMRTAQDFNMVCDGVVTHNFTFLRLTRCVLFRGLERLRGAGRHGTYDRPPLEAAAREVNR